MQQLFQPPCISATPLPLPLLHLLPLPLLFFISLSPISTLDSKRGDPPASSSPSPPSPSSASPLRHLSLPHLYSGFQTGRSTREERKLMENVESPLAQKKRSQENLEEADRNLEQEKEVKEEDQIKQAREGEGEGEGEGEEEQGDKSQGNPSEAASISADINHFLSLVSVGRDIISQNQSHHDPPEIPEAAVERLESLVEEESTNPAPAIGLVKPMSSIKADNSKIPIPGGAIHPLTRYVMNYLEYVSRPALPSVGPKA